MNNYQSASTEQAYTTQRGNIYIFTCLDNILLMDMSNIRNSNRMARYSIVRAGLIYNIYIYMYNYLQASEQKIVDEEEPELIVISNATTEHEVIYIYIYIIYILYIYVYIYIIYLFSQNYLQKILS